MGVVYYQRLRHMVSDKFQVSVPLPILLSAPVCPSQHLSVPLPSPSCSQHLSVPLNTCLSLCVCCSYGVLFREGSETVMFSVTDLGDCDLCITGSDDGVTGVTGSRGVIGVTGVTG